MTRRTRIWASLAAAWTSLYVVSKVAYAVDERLGVTGGPAVPPARYAEFGPGEVAAAQWANAAVGVLGVLLLVATLAPVVGRLDRWVRTAGLALLWLVATAGAVGMLGRALVTDSGGALFGGYCVVWSVLVTMTLLAHHRRPATGGRPRPRSARRPRWAPFVHRDRALSGNRRPEALTYEPGPTTMIASRMRPPGERAPRRSRGVALGGAYGQDQAFGWCRGLSGEDGRKAVPPCQQTAGAP